MITLEKKNLEKEVFGDATFGEIVECNFQGAVFITCVFAGLVAGCNFTDARFDACVFSGAVFEDCNFAGAVGMGEVAGTGNNYEKVGGN